MIVNFALPDALAGRVPVPSIAVIPFSSGARTPNYSDWFGLFHVPQITSPDKAAAAAYEDRHIFFAYALLALIVIHLVAALWHHFVRHDRVTARMIDGAPG